MDRRLWSKVVRDGDCWLYTGQPSQRYPKVRRAGVQIDVAQYVWALFGRPAIGEGETLRRMCRQTRCVRLCHLHPMSLAEITAQSNRDRGAAQTHCKRGHPRNEVNSRVWTNPKTGWTMTWCRMCDADRKRDARAHHRRDALRQVIVADAERFDRNPSSVGAPWFPFVWFAEQERILELDELARLLRRHAKTVTLIVAPMLRATA